jgi:hypothetical protein
MEGLIARTRGRVWLCEVARDRLHDMKTRYVFTGVYRVGDRMRIWVVGEGVEGCPAEPAEPTLEDAYLDVMALAEDGPGTA